MIYVVFTSKYNKDRFSIQFIVTFIRWIVNTFLHIRSIIDLYSLFWCLLSRRDDPLSRTPTVIVNVHTYQEMLSITNQNFMEKSKCQRSIEISLGNLIEQTATAKPNVLPFTSVLNNLFLTQPRRRITPPTRTAN